MRHFEPYRPTCRRCAPRQPIEQLEPRQLLATFVVTSAADAGVGSLRQAVINANATPAADEINFNIPGGGLAVIALASSLPPITAPLSILGGSQPGSMVNNAEHGTNAVINVSINGPGAGTAISIQAGNCVVRGLAIGGFGTGVEVLGGQSSRVEGNFLGVATNGTTAAANGSGIVVQNASSVTIGGAAPAARNLISGNTSFGLLLDPGANLIVAGNLIGTDRTGEAALGNDSHGILVFSGTVISNNVISGNGGSGVEVRRKNVSLHGNRIGVGSAGVTSIPNDRNGIHVFSGEDVRVGDLSQRPNVIANNGIDGIQVGANARRTLFLNNITRNNDQLGINLAGGVEDQFGTTANDAQDVDGGANRLQNWPILTSANTSTSGTAVIGSLNSTPNTAFTIEFYGNLTNDPSGHGEGAVRLGNVIVTTDGNGNAMFNVAGPATLANFISATATDNTALETSEFSTSVNNQKPFPTIPVTSNATFGVGTLDDAIVIANNMSGVQGISFNLPAGQATITLNSQLPGFFDSIIIDGSTQPGFAGVPLVHLTRDPGLAFLSNGLFLGADAAGSAVSWMTFSRFTSSAIQLAGGGDHAIAYNNFGTAIAGNNKGIESSASHGNLYMGNTFVNGAGSINPAGLVLVGSLNNMISANRFGVTIDGAALPNIGDAIRIAGLFGDPPANNTVTQNLIANSSMAGVALSDANGGSTGNHIFANSIYNNGGLGIDLHGAGVTNNDNGDGDGGANLRQNFPLLTTATAAALGGINVAGTLNSTPNAMFTVDVYANDAADPTNHGEGRYWLGSFVLTTNSSGNATFNQHLAAEAAHSQRITATATDAEGNTSEFGPTVSFVDATAPTVLAQSFDVEFGIEYAFQSSEDVTVQLAAAHLTGVTRFGEAAVFDPIAVSFDPQANEATFAFPNGIPDGNYHVTLDPALVLDTAGNSLAVAPAPPLQTFILAADATRDRSVNLDDFTALAANFGLTGRVFSQGNFNHSPDGAVNLDDFTILASQFGKSLPAPASLPRLGLFGDAAIGPAAAQAFRSLEAIWADGSDDTDDRAIL